MSYTLDNSINDLLTDEMVADRFNYLMPTFFLQIVPEDMRDLPLREIRKKLQMPWGVPYLSEEVLEVANKVYEIVHEDDYAFVQIWKEETPIGYYPNPDGTKEQIALLKLHSSFKPGRPMALVVPGGAYMSCAVIHEGIKVGKALAKMGYAVGILNYRCAPNHFPAPQMDLALAIKWMRAYQKQYMLSDDLLTIGFSAGGHLVASEACYAETIEAELMKELKETECELYDKFRGISAKPDKVCLSYPVIDFVEEQHEESFVNLTGGDEALRDFLSIDRHVGVDYPKTFVWACDDDELVPASNAKRMADALHVAGVNYRYESYSSGGHGISLGEGTSAEGWIYELVSFMRN